MWHSNFTVRCNAFSKPKIMSSASLSENALSLCDLAAFDSTVAGVTLGQGGEKRCLCPRCGHDKPRDAAHRCLSLNTSSGLWHCYRCGEGGKIREIWEDRSPLAHRERARAGWHEPSLWRLQFPRLLLINPHNPMQKKRTKSELRRGNVICTVYARLMARAPWLICGGVVWELKLRAQQARFSPDFMGHPAIVLPLRAPLSAAKRSTGSGN